MECTTCHNVHDNTQTPFLQRNLFTGGPGATRSFCEVCHATDRGANWNGAGGTTTEIAPNGEHPVNLGLVLGSVSTRTLGGRVGRFIQIDTYGATRVYDVATANGAAGLQTQAQSYVTGGKVSSWGAATTGNTFGCYTCHSAHMDSGATANLVLRDTVSANGQWNPLCLGCHGRLAPSATEGNDDNPGLSGFTHPCGPSAPTATNTTGAPAAVTFPNSTGATFTFNVNVSAIRGYPAVIGSITNGGVGMDVATFKPRCTSCHDVHGGVAGTMAIADLDGTVDGTMTGAVCYRCHMNGDLPDVTDAAGAAGEAANSHHRTSATAMATPTNAWTTADAGDPLTIDTPSWAGTAMPTGDTFGNLADGLSCPDCHVFNGTAHNW
jgi:predicted CXXCH cytochrome family protein